MLGGEKTMKAATQRCEDAAAATPRDAMEPRAVALAKAALGD